MRTFYYAKIAGYVPIIDEDRSLTDAYVSWNNRARDGEPMRDRDGNRMLCGTVLAANFAEACAKVSEEIKEKM